MQFQWTDGFLNPGWVEGIFQERGPHLKGLHVHDDGQSCSTLMCKSLPISASLRTSATSHHSEENQCLETLSLEDSLSLLEHGTDVLSAENYACILHKCRKQNSLVHAKHVYIHICGDGLEGNRVLGNHLVPTFVECGSVFKAQQVFNRLVHHNEHSWTALLQGYANLEEFDLTLTLFQKMKVASVYPSKHTFVPLLKACSGLNCIEKGRDVHGEIITQGFETDLFLGDTLVDMYAKCGSLAEAQEVFDKLLVRGVVSWTALIAGYVEHGFGEDALHCLTQMQLEGVCPNAVTCMFSLKACGSIGDMGRGQEIHALVNEDGFENDPFVGSALIDMYANCGSIAQAQDVFDELPVHNVVLWTAIMAGYAEHGLGEEALDCLKQMQLEGMSANAFTFACTLKACGSLGAKELGQKIHHEIVKEGVEKDLFIGCTLVDAYAKCGSLEEAQKVFDELPIRDVVSWTTLVALYADYECCEQALDCVKQMRLEGMSPNDVTYVCSLRACGSIGAIDRGLQVHAEVVKEGLERDPNVAVALVEMYGKCGSFTEAQGMFDSLSVQGVASWTALIAGYAEHGLGDEVLFCLKQMQLESISPDTVIFFWSLKACASLGDIERAREIHDYIAKDGFESDLCVGSSLVDMYAKCDSIAEAQEVFELLPTQDVILWTALIAGYAKHGCLNEALDCFEQMQLESICPNAVTLLCILKCCCTLGDIGNGQYIHDWVVKKGLERDSVIGSNLVNMYAKSGSLPEAQEVFDEMLIKDVDMWSALIDGCAEHGGFDEEALRCFTQMQQQGIAPSTAVFISVLKACGNLVAIDKGQEIHASIVKEGMENDVLVGGALVFMYVEFGMLEDAQGVFDKLSDRNLVIWTALIHGYVKYGHDKEAYNCMKQMQLQSIYPTATVFVYMVRSCSRGDALDREAIDRGQEIHMDIAKAGLEGDSYVASALVDMYAKCGSLAEARKVFDKLSDHDTVSWTMLIAGYADQGLGEEALKCLEQMQLECVSPDAVTFTTSLKACSSAEGALDRGREIHSQIVINAFELDPFMGNTLVDMYVKCGSLGEAQRVFDKLAVQSLVSWSALISGCAEHGLFVEVLDHLKHMQLDGISPDGGVLVCGLNACGILGAIEKGRELHIEIFKVGFEEDPYVGGSLVDMYAKCGSFAEAWEVFDKVRVQNVVLWTALISAYANHGLGEEALSCLDQMQSKSVPPDAVTFICSIGACSSIGAINKGQEIHIEIVKTGLERSPIIGSTLLNMYRKCGYLIEAKKVFDQMPVQDVVSWTELMSGYGEYKLGEEALHCLQQMQMKGTSPDAIAFVCSLKACVCIGAIDRGRELHAQVVKEGSEIDPFVGSILVSFYVKHCSVEEAQQVFDTLQDRDVVLWAALLTGYAEHKLHDEVLKGLEQMVLEGMPESDVMFVSRLKSCVSLGVTKMREYATSSSPVGGQEFDDLLIPEVVL